MSAVLFRTALFTAAVVLLLTYIRSSASTSDLLGCTAIQIAVPLTGWLVIEFIPSLRRAHSAIQAIAIFAWTLGLTFALIKVADRLHNSTIYQPSRPWDPYFSESGIIVYSMLFSPLLALAAALLTHIQREKHPQT